MVIRVLDVVRACNTASEGAVVARAVKAFLDRGEKVELSFGGVSDVPSSFVNASIVYLFNEMPNADLSQLLKITNVTTQIAEMIRRCLDINRRKSQAA